MTRARTMALVIGLLIPGLGCAGSDQHVVAECVAAGPAVLVHVRPGREKSMGFGVLDGNLLLLHAEALSAETSPYWRIVAEWHAPSGNLLAAPEILGVSELAIEARLLSADGALHAQLWVDLNLTLPPAEADDVLAMWEFRGSEDHLRHRIDLPISRTRPCATCGRANLGFDVAGLDAGGGRLPAARTVDGIVSAISAVPEPCMSTFGNHYRPWIFSAAGGGMVQWWQDERTCALHDWDLEVSNVELVTLDGLSDLGLLMRLGTGGPYGNVYYVRLHDGQPMGGPRRVGGTWTHYANDGGYQPEATRIGQHIVFMERAHRPTNGCQVLRRIDFDGHGGGETPWQLPCRDDESFYTAASELSTLPVDVDHAGELGAAVYGQSAAADPTQQGIYLTLLDESGRRASEIVRVTAEEPGLSSGPYTEITTATEGHSIYVLWTDYRPDAPGRYVRRFDCAELPTAAP